MEAHCDGWARFGFAGVAAVSPRIRPGDPAGNAKTLAAAIPAGACGAVLFPELCIAGATCGDLFANDAFLDAAEAALGTLAAATRGLPAAVFAGAPVRAGSLVFDACVAMAGGEILGAVPKHSLSAARGETRHFAPGASAPREIRLCGRTVPFGADIVFRDSRTGAGYCVAVGEDLGAPLPPYAAACAAGAETVLAPSALPEAACGARGASARARAASAALPAACAFANAGDGESSTDFVFGGECGLFECGGEVACGAPGLFAADAGYVRHARRRDGAFAAAAAGLPPARVAEFASGPSAAPFPRAFPRSPFIPEDPAERRAFAEKALSMQARGLAARMRAIGCKNAVIGISGGLDSALALLAARRAFELLGLPADGIRAITMPGFGTTGRTRSNAGALCEALGIAMDVVDIAPAAAAHLRDIGHPGDTLDAAYENCQARERTQVLMDRANMSGGIVVGTGDMSEAALGWCTYNGDHMSMYAVNSGVPKTMVRLEVSEAAAALEAAGNAKAAAALRDIVDTPVSPELLPAGEDGAIAQKTEDSVGPYELHDFFLWHLLERGAGRAKIAFAAKAAFAGRHSAAETDRWLGVFFKRFFSQQFKRSCSPDGPQVLPFGLSPRGGLAMPSDASPAAFS